MAAPRTAQGDAAAQKAELVAIVRDRSFKRGKFTLASGRESELYFNLKPTMMHPRGAHLSARALLATLADVPVDWVGGLEMGAVPVISALAALSDIEGRPVKTFFVRKAAKDHGTQEKIEGLGPQDSLAGQRVVIVDDVATTAGSIFKAVESARAAGAVVDTAVVLLDRQEGGTEFLAGHGIKLLSVLTAADFA